MPSPSSDFSDEFIRAEAARWIVRRDRGLSRDESIEYELWLAADERHAAAIKRATDAWSLLDRIPEGVAVPVVAAVARRRSLWRGLRLTGAIAAAVALALGVFAWTRSTPRAPVIANAGPHTVILSDGSVVQLDAGSEITERFTPAERRVLLDRGAAHFAVTKNPARPFTVRAGRLQISAVGTAFMVNLQTSAVDVIVTEGRVKLTALRNALDSEPNPASNLNAPTLGAGERAVLRGDLGAGRNLSDALERSVVNAPEMARALAWRQPLLRLGGVTLGELAVEFERATGRRLVFAEPSLADLRFGGRFRGDDIEGFTHVLATQLDLEVERANDGSIVLREKKSNSR